MQLTQPKVTNNAADEPATVSHALVPPSGGSKSFSVVWLFSFKPFSRVVASMRDEDDMIARKSC